MSTDYLMLLASSFEKFVRKNESILKIRLLDIGDLHAIYQFDCSCCSYCDLFATSDPSQVADSNAIETISTCREYLWDCLHKKEWTDLSSRLPEVFALVSIMTVLSGCMERQSQLQYQRHMRYCTAAADLIRIADMGKYTALLLMVQSNNYFISSPTRSPLWIYVRTRTCICEG